VPYLREGKGKMAIFNLLIINKILRYSRRRSLFRTKGKKEDGELFPTFVAKWGQALIGGRSENHGIRSFVLD